MILASELVVAILTILFVPPRHPGVIIFLIVLISLMVFQLARRRFSRRYSLLISLLPASVMILLALRVFDIINAALLVSLFVGINILLRQSNG